MADEAPTAVRQFQSEIDAIRHADEPLSVRAAMFVFVAAVVVGVLILTLARVDRVISSMAGKIVSVDAPLVMQALDPSIVKSIDVRDGEVVEQGRLLATLDPTFAAADVSQLEQQIASLNAQITRDEAELAHQAPVFAPTADPSEERYDALQKAMFEERAAQYAAQVQSLDQKIALTEATIAKYQNDEARYRERLGIASEVEAMRTTLAQHGNESRLNLLGSMDAKVEAVRTMEFDHNSLIEAQRQLDGAKADREAFVQQWFSQISQDLVTARNNRDAAASQLEKATKHRDLVRLIAPERAIVLALAKGVSVGSVLKEGDTLMTLAPMNAPVEAEIDVASRDVGFVRVGDPATIKIDAFNFAEHGTVEGVVKWISEDAFTTDDNGVATPAYYRVRVKITAIKLVDVPSTFRLIPGMTLVGDVKVGTRALGAYLVGGIVHGVGEAMREP
ncbi:MAG TPA: HlyD family type I secretion periplasmic adaptor subunit [Roseiarcus sp.]|nr:HlyD family type I secretion periplasmic adaptor subunit [Roseiarcus sp.]